jgi:hypothetical protein
MHEQEQRRSVRSEVSCIMRVCHTQPLSRAMTFEPARYFQRMLASLVV